MKSIKKIFISIGAAFTGFLSKIYMVDALTVEDKYGVASPKVIQAKYGVYTPEPTVGEKLLNISKFAIPTCLFLIGLVVVLNKKITTKSKTIIIPILGVLAILIYFLISYIITLI